MVDHPRFQIHFLSITSSSEDSELKCSKCQFENPEGMNFCGGCGAKLDKPCSGCSHANPPQFKFCGKCGQSLIHATPRTPKDLSFDEKLAKIQRYLPEGLTQRSSPSVTG
jgi:hypothetical protein